MSHQIEYAPSGAKNNFSEIKIQMKEFLVFVLDKELTTEEKSESIIDYVTMLLCYSSEDKEELLANYKKYVDALEDVRIDTILIGAVFGPIMKK